MSEHAAGEAELRAHHAYAVDGGGELGPAPSAPPDVAADLNVVCDVDGGGDEAVLERHRLLRELPAAAEAAPEQPACAVPDTRYEVPKPAEAASEHGPAPSAPPPSAPPPSATDDVEQAQHTTDDHHGKFAYSVVRVIPALDVQVVAPLQEICADSGRTIDTAAANAQFYLNATHGNVRDATITRGGVERRQLIVEKSGPRERLRNVKSDVGRKR